MHAVAAAQVPDAVQVCVCVPSEHLVSPGTQVPPQALPTHANWQAVAVPHWPVELQVCTVVLLAHCVSLGVHTPPHALPVQT